MSQGRNDRFYTRTRGNRLTPNEQSFRCLSCGLDISCAPEVSGVQNRNHCPICLWSRHMDWRIVGDRRSGCRAAMRPVGLTTKHRHNKYASACDGELMLLHQCSRCAKIVINRIAADDDLVALFAVFEDSCASEVFQTEAIRAGIAILTAANRELVRLRLLGHTQVDRSHVWRETQRV